LPWQMCPIRTGWQSNTNTPTYLQRWQQRSTGVVDASFGAQLDILMEVASGGTEDAGQIEVTWSNAIASSQVSEMKFGVWNINNRQQLLQLLGGSSPKVYVDSPFQIRSYNSGSLPSASTYDQSIIYISDEEKYAYSNGSEWLRFDASSGTGAPGYWTQGESSLLYYIDGCVGIGTNLPEQNLDVSGTTRITGDTTLEASLFLPNIENYTGIYQLYYDASNGQVTFGDSSSLIIDNSTSLFDQARISLGKSSLSQNIGGTGITTLLTWNDDIYNLDTSTFSHIGSDSSIEILKTGRYIVISNIRADNTGTNRIMMFAYVKKNDASINHSNGYGYSRGVAYGDGEFVISVNTVVDCNSGDYLEIETWNLDPDQTDAVNTIDNFCEFTILKAEAGNVTNYYDGSVIYVETGGLHQNLQEVLTVGNEATLPIYLDVVGGGVDNSMGVIAFKDSGGDYTNFIGVNDNYGNFHIALNVKPTEGDKALSGEETTFI